VEIPQIQQHLTFQKHVINYAIDQQDKSLLGKSVKQKAYIKSEKQLLTIAFKTSYDCGTKHLYRAIKKSVCTITAQKVISNV
jgi:hypothetical protein